MKKAAAPEPAETSSEAGSISPAASKTSEWPGRVERPRELQGSTWRIPFEGQNLYVTVNHDGERIASGRRAHERARSFDVHAYARSLAEIYQRIAPVSDYRELP